MSMADTYDAIQPHTLAILLAPGLAAADCQRCDLPQRQEKAEAKICSPLAAVGTAQEQAAALPPTSTVAEAQADDKSMSLEQATADLKGKAVPMIAARKALS